MLRIREREKGHHDFPSKICCLTVPKKFVKEPSCFGTFRVSKNVRDRRGGRVSRFSVQIVLSHSTETLQHFVEEPFCAVFQKISGGEKVYG